MGISRCQNGHFYDDELHDECPYCSSNPQSAFLDRSTEAIRMQTEEQTNQAAFQNDNTNVNESATVQKGYNQPDINEQKTVYKGRANSKDINEAHTVARRNVESKTVGLANRKLGMDPVVGWLVCIDGVDRGRDFRLHSGRSYIGRSQTMDIPLTKDMSIASQNHASVVYDPKKNKFFLVSISGMNTYVNNEPALEIVELKNYDIIQVGETKLHFVAYCEGENKWEEK